MAGVHRKYDTNFREIGVSVRRCHSGWLSHEAALEKINERCTCGADGSEDEFETVETVSSHWGRGGLETSDYMLGTFKAHVHLSHNVTGG